MTLASRLLLAWKTLRELGPGQTLPYVWYQTLLRTGYLRWSTSYRRQQADQRHAALTLRHILTLPDREALSQILGKSGVAALLSEADEIASGKVRLFGGEALPLVLSPPGPLAHWTEQGEQMLIPMGLGQVQSDIKYLWEPGRFVWAYTLGRAYRLSQDERYANSFWELTETFLEANPPYLGPHWVSAQEVAFRLMALVFSAQAFAASPHSTQGRQACLSESVGAHARRIPPSLSYARAQNNNHLLGEAAGLITAGLALSDHPQARRWQELGWRWFHWGLQRQIAGDGAYIQHSSNYHRLMLQIALWVNAITRRENLLFPEDTCQRLGNATRWLLALVDPQSGGVPNLGPNDGAYLHPLTICPFQDYRPVLQAASAAFLNQRPFPPGIWDELSLWLGNLGQEEIQHPPKPIPQKLTPNLSTPHVLRIPSHATWAYFRVAHFNSRPGHADQLHLDLWWRGVNLAQDAGTYSYNAPSPWDNSLSRTSAHNTLTVNGQDQMTRAGRFLWLDWAQAQVLEHEKAPDGAWERLVARHDGYRRLGLHHQRAVTAFHDGRWQVEDTLLKGPALPAAPALPDGSQARKQARGRFKVEGLQRSNPTCNLHWLLPDWKWEVIENGESRMEIRLGSPGGWVLIEIRAGEGTKLAGVQLVRAGRAVYGTGDTQPFLGWVSPTYAHKVPALSLNVAVVGAPPLSLATTWQLPPIQKGQ